ncbi:MAG: hypothetical protein QG567_1330 [Campylobacterota bacterium]|nr:hypothetical protein [Campylobacterota bacterium]
MTHPALIKMLEKYDLSNSNSNYGALIEMKLWSKEFFITVVENIKFR